MTLDRKNKFLLFGFIVALYISYTFAVSNTIGYYKQYKSNTGKLAENALSGKTAAQLRLKEKQLDAILAGYSNASPESFQNDLLKSLSGYSSTYNLKITDFKEPHVAEKDGIVSTSYVFTLEGSFNGCLLLVNKIENRPGLGHVRHLNFIKKRDYKNNTDRLFAEVILQQNKSQ